MQIEKVEAWETPLAQLKALVEKQAEQLEGLKGFLREVKELGCNNCNCYEYCIPCLAAKYVD